MRQKSSVYILLQKYVLIFLIEEYMVAKMNKYSIGKP